MRLKKKSQAAFEYMLIMGIALALLIPLFTYVNTHSSNIKRDLRKNALQDSLDSITEASDMVHSQGEPAKITVDVRIPEGVRSIEINNRTIIAEFNINGEITSIVSSSDAPLQGNLPESPGGYKVVVKALENYVNISY